MANTSSATEHKEHAPDAPKNRGPNEVANDEGHIDLPTLSRQSICTADGATVGCELTLHESHNGAAILWSTLHQFGFIPTHQKQKVFVRADRSLLESAGLNLLPKEALVLVLDISGNADARLINRCRSLSERGFSLSLGHYRGIDARSRPLLSLLDMVEIHPGHCNEQELRDLAGSLTNLPIQLLANGIHSASQLARCQQLGFDYFQGSYLAPPSTVSKRHLPVSRNALLKLIALTDSHTDIGLIENALKKEIALIHHLLGLSLSLKEESSTPTCTLRNILTAMGAQRIRQWLQSHLEANEANDTDEASIHLPARLAALRGRLLELLAQRVDPGNTRLSDSAYLTGCLSTGPDVTSESWNGDPERAGKLGQLLDILELFDRHEPDACQERLHNISQGRLHYPEVTDCFERAFDWLTCA